MGLVVVENPTQLTNQAFNTGGGDHGIKPKKPDPKYRNQWFGPAADLGLPDRFTFEALTEYLDINGKFSMKAVSICMEFCSARLTTRRHV